jgi:hypothetical protein
MKKYFVLLGLMGAAGACHDSATAPLASLRAGNGAGFGLTARVSATGFLERRVEYDWTVRKYVSEIMDEHMIAEGSTTHTTIRPGEVKWIAYYIDPARTLASDQTIAGVRGEVCATNATSHSARRQKVFAQLQMRSGGTWTNVDGASSLQETTLEIPSEATRCFAYQLTYPAQVAATYRVLGGALTSSNTFAQAAAEFTPATTPVTIIVDAEAFARDEVFQACAQTLGAGFRCESVFSLPYTWHFTETSDGRWETFPPGDYYTYYVLDLINEGVCGKTVTYKNVAQLWESGPKPPGGETHEASATVTINTGECNGGAGCTRTIGYWKNHAGGDKKTDVVTPLLPVWLGTANGAKSVNVTTASQAIEILSKSDDASNGINKLMAQLLAAKLNILSGADPAVVAGIITRADQFLALRPASEWSQVGADDRQSVLSWAEFLDRYNNGVVGPGHCDTEGGAE